VQFKLVFFFIKDKWKCSLTEKFRNSRRRKDNSVPCVVENRKKFKPNPVDNGPKNKVSHGLINYMPASAPASEDCASIEKHQALLIKEFAKVRRDYLLMEISMQATFFDRRERIVQKNQGMGVIKEVYPCLFDAQQVTH